MSTYRGTPGGPSDPATPGPYCLARCYCGTCPQYARQQRDVEVLRQAEYEGRDRKEGERAARRERTTPQRARDTALAQVDARTDEHVRRTVDQALRELARRGEPFSANDLRPLLPPDIPGPVIGARFQAAARAGVIRKTDRRVPSTDARTHAHEIAVWEAAA